jgi:hypothetical protein
MKIRDHSEQNREQRNRSCVVEQSLAFDEAGQPRRCANIAKDGDYCGRVGRRHNGAEQQANDQWNLG